MFIAFLQLTFCDSSSNSCRSWKSYKKLNICQYVCYYCFYPYLIIISAVAISWEIPRTAILLGEFEMPCQKTY